MSSLVDRARFALDHRWAPEHMSEYLDGELGSGRRIRMDRHIAVCHECRTVLAGLRNILDALHRLPVPSAGTDAVQLAAAVRLQLGEARRSR
jgi:anti-sigma factor RsiW